jgi:hypothetical protein
MESGRDAKLSRNTTRASAVALLGIGAATAGDLHGRLPRVKELYAVHEDQLLVFAA